MNRQPVFVYGTLMPGFHNYVRCLRGRTNGHRPAVVAGVGLYRSRSLPYAAAAPGLHTHGYVIDLADRTYERTMDTLDQLEGYRAGTPADSHYVRTMRTVDVTGSATGRGTPLQAWIYLAGPRIDIRTLRPILSGRWTT